LYDVPEAEGLFSLTAYDGVHLGAASARLSAMAWNRWYS
jgi:hypothetical protein